MEEGACRLESGVPWSSLSNVALVLAPLNYRLGAELRLPCELNSGACVRDPSGRVKQQHFNSLEVTGIVAKRFLGVPYAVVSAHSRHVQQSCYSDSAEARRRSQRDAEWARGGARLRFGEWTYET